MYKAKPNKSAERKVIRLGKVIRLRNQNDNGKKRNPFPQERYKVNVNLD